MCNNCIHQPVCSIYRATGGKKSCEHFKEERKGRWVVDYADGGEAFSYAAFIEFHCSCCGLSVGMESGEYGWQMGEPVPWIACPNCGADMRCEKDDN